MRSSLIVWLLLGAPAVAAGQQLATPAPGALAALCAARAEDRDDFLAQVKQARGLASEDAARAAIDALEPEARRLAAASPGDAAAQYRLAAVLGAQLDHAAGSAKMSGAAEVKEQALRVLALEPEHAGASYMLGRIHASVLRLGGFKRFIARQLFGGDALEGASWDEAQALLETAVREDPCVPDHHFELARVYEEREDEAAMARELAHVRELTVNGDHREARLRERAEEMERRLEGRL